MAGALAERHPNVRVRADNQAVVDAASVIVLTVRPDVVASVLGELRVPDDRVVISAVAGWSDTALRERLGVDVPIVRSIPLPAVRRLRGVTALFPTHPAAEDLFGRLGGTLVAPDARTFDALSTATASISTYLHYMSTVADWVTKQGVPADAADRYVRGMFQGVDVSQPVPLADLADDHETPGGLNEALRTAWFSRAGLEQALDDIRERVADDG
ncbi:pyrroline-5-carboxylate reductase [Kibdelosporangium lantanae]